MVSYRNPDTICFRRDRKRLTASWTESGILHRENDQPAQIKLSLHRPALTLKWYHQGDLHRDEGPATVTIGSRDWGHDRRYEWYHHGHAHRQGRPSVLWYDPVTSDRDDDLFIEEWWWLGDKHRPNGPNWVQHLSERRCYGYHWKGVHLNDPWELFDRVPTCCRQHRDDVVRHILTGQPPLQWNDKERFDEDRFRKDHGLMVPVDELLEQCRTALECSTQHNRAWQDALLSFNRTYSQS